MHGQKKRRKRSLEGTLSVDGVDLKWQVTSEPQWTTEDGYRGVRISVQTNEESHRELILQYPMPKKRVGIGIPQLPQRPEVSAKMVEDGVREGIHGGWQPQSRGKAFVHHVQQLSD